MRNVSTSNRRKAPTPAAADAAASAEVGTAAGTGATVDTAVNTAADTAVTGAADHRTGSAGNPTGARSSKKNCTGTEAEFHQTIVVGAGAAGLYFAARPAAAACDILILEKTQKIGTKLLMSGGGQCNLTHGGDIKEFLLRYGEKGRRIRTCLFQHNNQAVCKFFEGLGVQLTEREDGKIFPASLDARQVRDALLAAALEGGASVHTGAAVTAIRPLQADQAVRTGGAARFLLSTADGRRFSCRNLVIATGGCSYPSTGSDGSLFPVLERDLDIPVVPPAPALAPAYIENYPFSDLSGISMPVQIKIFPPARGAKPAAAAAQTRDAKAAAAADTVPAAETAPAQARAFTGDLLLTHRNLSGPVILNHSRYMKSGTRLEINFLFPYTITSNIHQMKSEFPGNTKTIENWMALRYGLPKRFCEVLCALAKCTGRKVSTLSGEELKHLAGTFCAFGCVVSGLGSFREAMVTAGGVSLDAVSLKTMESKSHPGLYFIGETLDIDGDTGGYNLQFAFASAAAAAKQIEKQSI